MRRWYITSGDEFDSPEDALHAWGADWPSSVSYIEVDDAGNEVAHGGTCTHHFHYDGGQVVDGIRTDECVRSGCHVWW